VAGRSTRSLGVMNTAFATSRIRSIIAVSVLALAGCAESSFVLAPDSRLPAWFEIPAGRTRGELTVTMDYYIPATGSEAMFKLFDSRGQQLMASWNPPRVGADTATKHTSRVVLPFLRGHHGCWRGRCS
jgi:hypothetical protein